MARFLRDGFVVGKDPGDSDARIRGSLETRKSGEIGKIGHHNVWGDVFPKHAKNGPQVLSKHLGIITVHQIVDPRPYGDEIRPGAELLRDAHLFLDEIDAGREYPD